MTILLTIPSIFPVVHYLSSLWLIYFVTGSLYLLISLTYFISPSNPSSSRATTCLLSASVTLFWCYLWLIFSSLVSDSTYKWNHTVFVFLHLTFHVAWYPLGPSMLLQITGFPSFLWLNDIVLFIYASFSLFIHPLMATQVVSMSQLLCIMLQWNGECFCFSLSKKIEHFFSTLHHVVCSDGLHSLSDTFL